LSDDLFILYLFHISALALINNENMFCELIPEKVPLDVMLY